MILIDMLERLAKKFYYYNKLDFLPVKQYISYGEMFFQGILTQCQAYTIVINPLLPGGFLLASNLALDSKICWR